MGQVALRGLHSTDAQRLWREWRPPQDRITRIDADNAESGALGVFARCPRHHKRRGDPHLVGCVADGPAASRTAVASSARIAFVHSLPVSLRLRSDELREAV
jgi:hypothetical protein